MHDLSRFIEMISGTFDNRDQCQQEDTAGERIHPLARHVIAPCNERIMGLPADFPGCFVIEESHFDLGERQVDKNYLFLYALNERGQVVLSSYDPPPTTPTTALRAADAGLRLPYDAITLSPRFTPLELEECDGGYFGSNVSEFSPGTLFHFSLRVSDQALHVTELLTRNGERLAGYDTPIVYVRTH
ncbi:MAG: hypothetical protein VB139_10490 [Coriobacteriia bacterium]|nr:hypothetical protein [Coriobacteriia bacterium]